MKTIKFLFIVIISILLISCNPCKRLTRKCPPVIKDSISYVETIKFDTIVLVSPADTLIIRIPVEHDLNYLIVDASIEEIKWSPINIIGHHPLVVIGIISIFSYQYAIIKGDSTS